MQTRRTKRPAVVLEKKLASPWSKTHKSVHYIQCQSVYSRTKSINPFSGMPGNVPGLSLVPILLYPVSFPCCIQCSMRSCPKYFQAHIIHVE